MEFSNFYANIKSEEAAAAAAAAGWEPHRQPQKVNPFMQWAVASISGIYFGGPAAAHPTDQPGRRFFSYSFLQPLKVDNIFQVGAPGSRYFLVMDCVFK